MKRLLLTLFVLGIFSCSAQNEIKHIPISYHIDATVNTHWSASIVQELKHKNLGAVVGFDKLSVGRALWGLNAGVRYYLRDERHQYFTSLIVHRWRYLHNPATEARGYTDWFQEGFREEKIVRRTISATIGGRWYLGRFVSFTAEAGPEYIFTNIERSTANVESTGRPRNSVRANWWPFARIGFGVNINH